MPDDLSILDQLEEWLEAQVPPDLHDLPSKMLETMERVTNEIFESLNIHGPPSISIPFPPFSGKEAPLPPSPPPPPSFQLSLYDKAGRSFGRYARDHPYAARAMAMTVGAGIGLGFVGLTSLARTYQLKLGWPPRIQKIGTRGHVKDGMLQEAIVLLSPSPMPPMLWPLAVTLLRAGYIVLIAVPNIGDAEQLERRLTLDEKSALRVLIYDPEDSATFPPFQRSVGATLTLRFPAPGGSSLVDTYKPAPQHLPHIHAFISLYALNPSPPTQPGALPALPTLLAPGGQRRPPRLVTLYPSGSLMATPDSFASQLLTDNHLLLQRNLIASTRGTFISIFVGHLQLPPLVQMMMRHVRPNAHDVSFRLQMKQASAIGKLNVIKDFVLGGLGRTWHNITGYLGVGFAAQDYKYFERCILRALKSRYPGDQAIGQYSLLSLAMRDIHPRWLDRFLAFLPIMPGATGPLSEAVPGLPAPRMPLTSVSSANSSNSGSDHEGGEDLASSRHTVTSDESGSGGSGTGLDASWVGV